MKITFQAIAYLFAAVLLIGIGYSLAQLHQPPVSPTPTPVPTATPEGGGFSPAPIYARMNDTASVDYVLWVNGSIIDTSIESYARGAGIYTASRNYTPFNFTLGNSEVIPGFENAVLGMRVGESKNVTIPPEQGYGNYDVTKERAVMEVYSVPRQETMPLSQFMAMFPDFNISQSQSVMVDVWNATVLSMTNETVTLRFNPDINATRPSPAGTFPEAIYAVNDTSISIRRNAQVGSAYIWYDETGAGNRGVVKWIQDGVIMMDMNPPLAGQNLTFMITLVAVKKNSTGG